jgi:hypothetical protein
MRLHPSESYVTARDPVGTFPAPGRRTVADSAQIPDGHLNWPLAQLDKPSVTAALSKRNRRLRRLPFRLADLPTGVSMPGLHGRFGAEWCPARTTSGRASLRHKRGRTDGGVMVRRAVLDRGDQLAADDEALPLGQPSIPWPEQGQTHWRGAGGRWLVWVARAIAWAVLILIGYRGVAAILQGHTNAGRPTPTSNNSRNTRTQFPIAIADAFALQFGDVYLNFSPGTAGQRSRALARFLPPSSDSQLGWNGAGTQRLLSEQVVSTSVTGSHTAVVTLLARVTGGSMFELGVPIYAAHGGMSVSGEPAVLPAPPKAIPPPAANQKPSDPAAQAQLQSQLPAFFQAFAGSDRSTLTRFDAPGTHITGLHGAVGFGAIDNVYVPAGGATRQITVTVTWGLNQAPGRRASSLTTLEVVYQMTVTRQGSSWDVQSIGTSTQAQGPP